MKTIRTLFALLAATFALATGAAAQYSSLVGSVNSTGTVVTIANEGSTGTLRNGLAKTTGAPSTAIKTAITDVTGAIGIVTAGEGTTANATVQTTGVASCVFENSTVAGDYVIIGNTTAGNCRDGGSTRPTNGGDVIGTVGDTGAAGLHPVSLFGPDERSLSPAFVTSAYTNATTTFSTITNMSWTIAANTNYQMVCQFTWQGSATTAGPKFQLTGPASPTAVTLNQITGITSATSSNTSTVGFSSTVANSSAITITTNFPGVITAGIVNGANAGTVALQAAANGAGTLTIQPGSSCKLTIQ